MNDWRYATDFPPDTPNTWVAIDGWHADQYGCYRTGWLAGTALVAPATTGEGRGYQSMFAYQTAAGAAQTVMAVEYGGGTLRVIVYDGSSWAARTGTAGGARVFAQLGNYTLAVGGGGFATLTNIHYRDATGTNNFASAGAASKIYCGVAVTALNIAVAVSGSDDYWATSDIGDPTNWSTLEATNGNFRQIGGVNTAVAALGNDAIAFKARGVFHGQYVGGDEKWIWRLVDSEKGAWGPECAVAGDNCVYFIGNAGAYRYDGNGFERIDFGVWQSLLGNLTGTDSGGQLAPQVKLHWDSIARRLCVFRRGNVNSASTGTRYVTMGNFHTYEPISKKWGLQGRVTNGGTESFTAVCDGSAYNTNRTYRTNVMLFSATNDAFKFVTDMFTAAALTTYEPQIRSHRFGNRFGMLGVGGFVPGWTKSDGVGTDLSTATLKTGTLYYSDSLNEAETAHSTTATLSTDLYRADVALSRRFISADIKINCEAVIDGVEMVDGAGNPGGRRAGRN